MAACPWCGFESDEEVCSWCKRSRYPVGSSARVAPTIMEAEESPLNRAEYLAALAAFAILALMLTALLLFRLGTGSQEMAILAPPRTIQPKSAPASRAVGVPPVVSAGTSPLPPEPGRTAQKAPNRPIAAAAAVVLAGAGSIEIVSARLIAYVDPNGVSGIVGSVRVKNLGASSVVGLSMTLAGQPLGDRATRIDPGRELDIAVRSPGERKGKQTLEVWATFEAGGAKARTASELG